MGRGNTQSGTNQLSPKTKQSFQVPSSERSDHLVWTRLDSNQSFPIKPATGFVEPNSSKSAGTAAATPDETVTLLPELSLEDRLMVALSKRGPLRIGQFVENARASVGHSAYCEEGSRCLFNFDDEALVLACERYAEECQ